MLKISLEEFKELMNVRELRGDAIDSNITYFITDAYKDYDYVLNTAAKCKDCNIGFDMHISEEIPNISQVSADLAKLLTQQNNIVKLHIKYNTDNNWKLDNFPELLRALNHENCNVQNLQYEEYENFNNGNVENATNEVLMGLLPQDQGQERRWVKKVDNFDGEIARWFFTASHNKFTSLQLPSFDYSEQLESTFKDIIINNQSLLRLGILCRNLHREDLYVINLVRKAIANNVRLFKNRCQEVIIADLEGRAIKLTNEELILLYKQCLGRDVYTDDVANDAKKRAEVKLISNIAKSLILKAIKERMNKVVEEIDIATEEQLPIEIVQLASSHLHGNPKIFADAQNYLIHRIGELTDYKKRLNILRSGCEWLTSVAGHVNKFRFGYGVLLTVIILESIFIPFQLYVFAPYIMPQIITAQEYLFSSAISGVMKLYPYGLEFINPLVDGIKLATQSIDLTYLVEPVINALKFVEPSMNAVKAFVGMPIISYMTANSENIIFFARFCNEVISTSLCFIYAMNRFENGVITLISNCISGIQAVCAAVIEKASVRVADNKFLERLHHKYNAQQQNPEIVMA